jgi:hypothetical protein
VQVQSQVEGEDVSFRGQRVHGLRLGCHEEAEEGVEEEAQQQVDPGADGGGPPVDDPAREQEGVQEEVSGRPSEKMLIGNQDEKTC